MPTTEIHIAHIGHRHGSTMYAGLSETDVRAKVAEYCCRNWQDEGLVGEPAHLTDNEVIGAYFDPETTNHEEWLVIGTDEIQLP